MGINKAYGISASSYVVMDMDTNRVLMDNNMHEQRLIASISKIMTAIIAIENKDINEKVKTDSNILKVTGSSMYLEVGETLFLKDLLYGMMLRSGNDAAMMIAIYVSGSMENFSKLMNEYAKKIGMNNTIFYNSHGLEDSSLKGNISTSYDMALLTSYAMKNDTFRKIFNTKEYDFKSDKKSYHLINKNKLLKYDYITGGKTGYTIKARRTLVSTASINNMNIVIVTLNDSNDWLDHLSLYKTVRNKYKNRLIIDKNNINIIKEKAYLKDDIYLTISKDEIKNLKIKYYLYDNKKSIGYVKVYLNNTEIIKKDLYKKEKKKYFKDRIISFLKKVFK